MSELQISNQELSRLTEEALSLVTNYWASVEERPAYPATSGRETKELFSRPWAEEGLGRDVLQDFKTIANHSRPSGDKFFGYVVGSGEPVGALGDLLGAVLNQNVTSWRSAPAAVSIEQSVVGWLAEAVGCTGFRGSLCGGGSAANVMGLAMAREAKAPANESGARPSCVVYASEQVHMSIPKAIALLGIGRMNLRLIPADDNFWMRLDTLEATIAADRKAGLTPIAIVATVGTVSTGSIDPLREIADIAQKEKLWLHVDGAYGGLAALAAPEKFDGLSSADSLSLDAHKWLYQPLDCGCLLYRDRQVALETFSHTGDYIKVFSEDTIQSFVFFEESMELSRRFRALKLWMSLQYHGRRAFREAIAKDLGHAQLWHKQFKRIRNWNFLRQSRLAPCASVTGKRITKRFSNGLSRVAACIFRMQRSMASSRCGRVSSTTARKKTMYEQSCPRQLRQPWRSIVNPAFVFR